MVMMGYSMFLSNGFLVVVMLQWKNCQMKNAVNHTGSEHLRILVDGTIPDISPIFAY